MQNIKAFAPEAIKFMPPYAAPHNRPSLKAAFKNLKHIHDGTDIQKPAARAQATYKFNHAVSSRHHESSLLAHADGGNL